MSDLELSTVCSFLNDLSLDEIMTYESDDGVDISTLGSDCSDANVTGATSDESSDWDDTESSSQSPLKKPRHMTESQRNLQRLYVIRSLGKKKAQRTANYQVFLAMVDKFLMLVQWRLEKTEKEIHLLCLAKKNGGGTPPQDAARQEVQLNHGPLSCIHKCLKNWEQQKKTSKFFFRAETDDLVRLMQRLTDIGERLSVATAELEWRLQDQTTGVWV